MYAFILLLATLSTPQVSDTNPSYSALLGIAWGKLIDARFQDGEFVVEFGPIALLVMAAVLVFAVFWRFWLRQRLIPEFEVVEAQLDLAHIGNVTIKPNHQNAQIAHEAWVELSTRKAALPFDESHDVVIEVYDSYYQLFGRLRDLTRHIPAQRLRQCPDTRRLVEIMIRVLNDGLRPHLTRWQAKYRRWYVDALKDPSNRDKTPQQIQKEFPEFAELAADLKALQSDIVKYATFLREIAHGKNE
jgi:hypothetical protein